MKIQATLLLFMPQLELELDPMLNGLEKLMNTVGRFLHCYIVFQLILVTRETLVWSVELFW